MYQPAHGRFVVAEPRRFLPSCRPSSATLVTVGRRMRTILPMPSRPPTASTACCAGTSPRQSTGARSPRSTTGDRDLQRAGRLHLAGVVRGEAATGKVVPTWNYTTVVAHGRLTLHHEPEWLIPHVAGSSTATRPAARPVERRRRPADFVTLQAGDRRARAAHRADRCKRKLTQNRSDADFDGVVEALSVVRHASRTSTNPVTPPPPPTPPPPQSTVRATRATICGHTISRLWSSEQGLRSAGWPGSPGRSSRARTLASRSG